MLFWKNASAFNEGLGFPTTKIILFAGGFYWKAGDFPEALLRG